MEKTKEVAVLLLASLDNLANNCINNPCSVAAPFRRNVIVKGIECQSFIFLGQGVGEIYRGKLFKHRFTKSRRR